MGVPVAISDGTLYIDVDTDTVGLAYNQEENIHQKTEKIVRNNANIKNFMMASGLMGHTLKDMLWVKPQIQKEFLLFPSLKNLKREALILTLFQKKIRLF